MTQYVINSYLKIVVQQKSQSGQILVTISHIRPKKKSDALLAWTFSQITIIRVFIFPRDCRISSYTLLITFQKHSIGALPALLRRFTVTSGIRTLIDLKILHETTKKWLVQNNTCRAGRGLSLLISHWRTVSLTPNGICFTNFATGAAITLQLCRVRSKLATC